LFTLQQKVLSQVDKFAKDIQESMATRNLTDIVDIIFVSDHGMTDTSHPTLVYIDDIIGQDGLDAIAHEDGWPAMGLRFKKSANVTHYFNLLKAAADKDHGEKFDVYTHETMPKRWHFSHGERIAPVYVVPRIGYVLTTRKEGDVGMSKGVRYFPF
jgi:predicted AlkP superfamily pyrophosphatase or phosphodiesterase